MMAIVSTLTNTPFSRQVVPATTIWQCPRRTAIRANQIEEVSIVNITVVSEPFVQTWFGLIVLLAGLGLSWHGLVGGRNGDSGLLTSRALTIRRMEGFRLVVVGLVVVGLGTAVIWQSQLLLFLAIGIGLVEILESSAVIATMKSAGLNR